MVPALNAYLQLASLPTPLLRLTLAGIMLADLGAAWLVEVVTSWLLYPAACRDPTDALLR